jgi:hypothetical protein
MAVEGSGWSLIFPAHTADFVFLDGQIDLLQDSIDIGQSFVKDDLTGQGEIRSQQATFVVRPDFLAELGVGERGRKLLK